MDIKELQRLNPDKKIYSIDDEAYKPYGRVLGDVCVKDLVEYIDKNIEIPASGSKYVPSVPELEAFDCVKKIEDLVYGQMEVEAGYCAGYNDVLGGLEFHQGSEVAVTTTDTLFIVGKKQDMSDEGDIDGSKLEYFYIKRGQVVEMYSTTLHYCPVHVDDNGFFTLVILLRGTNTALDHPSANKLFTKKNKGFICHTSNTAKIEAGSYPGLKGDLIKINLK
ncbi:MULTISPECIES: DUF4867 family protein [Oscillospiraceae]|uniref:DUF4867 family protein n=1 Tax=Oscillospiraceae TaxID=216572 RepID=UPI0009A8843B|nr:MULTISPECIES: DUF4867 family protein [Oscillospiraceae]RGB64225.1 DUF4867 family protein [Harryflintia acetispora]